MTDHLYKTFPLPDLKPCKGCVKRRRFTSREVVFEATGDMKQKGVYIAGESQVETGIDEYATTLHRYSADLTC